jgi:hypothetical protein
VLFDHREEGGLTMAITGIHTPFYTAEFDAFREVMRDAFELPIVGEDMEEDGISMAFGLPEATTLATFGDADSKVARA